MGNCGTLVLNNASLYPCAITDITGNNSTIHSINDLFRRGRKRQEYEDLFTNKTLTIPLVETEGKEF
jgi:hypothetical protein